MGARSRSAVLAAALAIAAAVLLIPSGGQAGDRGHDHARGNWWGPPREVRGMLAQVSARNLRTDDLTLVGFGTRHTLSQQDDPNHGIGAARDWIYSQFQQDAAMSHGAMTVDKQAFVQPAGPRIPVPTTLTNVFATLHGTDPASADRVYVVSAHYDSRVTDVLNADAPGGEPGANDDASGVDAVLELARVFAAHPMQATIIFATFPGEEQGLFGSAFFAQQLKAAGTNVLGDLNMDIVGSSLGGNGVRDRHDIRLFNEGVPTAETPQQAGVRQNVGGENDGVSRQLARFVKETGENDTTDMTVALRFRRDRYLRGGDQISFLQQGYPAVRFTEPNENYDHEHQDVRVENGVQFGDLPQFVDFDFLARVTRVVGSTLAALASAPRPPQNTVTDNSKLTYDTDLKWTADPEPDVVGYEVVWRDTTEPLWTHARFVGDVTSYTLTGINKDDWQVGVRAVDSNGFKSPVAFAVPG
jgi:hypothetical protein